MEVWWGYRSLRELAKDAGPVCCVVAEIKVILMLYSFNICAMCNVATFSLMGIGTLLDG